MIRAICAICEAIAALPLEQFPDKGEIRISNYEINQHRMNLLAHRLTISHPTDARCVSAHREKMLFYSEELTATISPLAFSPLAFDSFTFETHYEIELFSASTTEHIPLCWFSNLDMDFIDEERIENPVCHFADAPDGSVPPKIGI
jgi:hypothetical protein